MQNSVEVPQKTKNRTIIWSSNPISGNISDENEIIISKRHLYAYVYCSIIYNSQDTETTYVSVSGSRDLKNVVCIDKGIFLATKKRENLPFVTT